MVDQTPNRGYALPERGREDWHTPVNQNFTAIDEDVERLFEAVENSSGDGGTGGWATPAERTVAGIDRAVSNADVVVLEPGVTYENDGSTITMPADRNVTLICYGATIQVRSNPTVLLLEGGVDANQFGWHALYGGFFEGRGNGGDVAIQAVDSIRTKIFPRAINDCECGIALTNDDLWCEYNEVATYFRNCETGLMLLGGDGSPPSGSNVTRPGGRSTGRDDSPSFRFLRANFTGKIDQSPSAQNRGYGIYQEEANPYAANMHVTISGGANTTIWRYHGRFNGSVVHLHGEAPQGSSDGGKGFVCDKNKRGPGLMTARIGGGVGEPFVNNTDEPIVYYDTAQNPSQNYWRLMRDGDVMTSFAKEGGDHVMRMPGIDRIEGPDNI